MKLDNWLHGVGPIYSSAQRKVFVELPAKACTYNSKVGLLLGSMYGCRDAGVNWEFAICKVMIEIGFVQGKASPCIYRHLERQLRVWVQVTSSMTSGSFQSCKSSGSLPVEELLVPLDITIVCKAFVCWEELWNGLMRAFLGRRIPDMLR